MLHSLQSYSFCIPDENINYRNGQRFQQTLEMAEFYFRFRYFITFFLILVYYWSHIKYICKSAHSRNILLVSLKLLKRKKWKFLNNPPRRLFQFPQKHQKYVTNCNWSETRRDHWNTMKDRQWLTITYSDDDFNIIISTHCQLVYSIPYNVSYHESVHRRCSLWCQSHW